MFSENLFQIDNDIRLQISRKTLSNSHSNVDVRIIDILLQLWLNFTPVIVKG